MEDRSEIIDERVERAETYGKTTLELIKLKSVDKLADGASSMAAWLAVIAALLIFFMTFNIGLALWIGAMVGGSYLGFFIVAGFYALIGLILLLFKNRLIKKPLSETIINQMLK